MSTPPIGIGSPETYGNSVESYAELLYSRIKKGQEEAGAALGKGNDAQATSIKDNLTEDIRQYEEYCTQHSLPNKLTKE